MTARASRRPMTVLLTADTVGGVWPHTIELARALAAEGARIVLATLGRRPAAAQAAEARAIDGLELHASAYRLPWMADPWEDVARAGAWLLELAEGSGCDVVHLSEPVFGALDWPGPVVAVGHSCVLSWFEAVRGEPAPASWSRYRAAMAAGLGAADAVVAPSRTMLRALERHYGVQGGIAIPNGRDPSAYAPGEKRAVVLTAGRLWDPAKNVGLLDAIAPGLAWPVEAAGDTRGPDGAAAAPRGLRLLGPLDAGAMAERFRQAAIYALPARYEPFGLSVLEAALAGCALVLGDIPSLRELWDGAALFAPADDPDAVRAALASAIRSPDLRATLGRRARRRALRYSPARMAGAYLALYAELTGRPASGPRPEVTACAS